MVPTVLWVQLFTFLPWFHGSYCSVHGFYTVPLSQRSMVPTVPLKVFKNQEQWNAWNYGTMEHWNHGTVGTMEHWNHGTVRTMERWNHGTLRTMEQWNNGTMERLEQ